MITVRIPRDTRVATKFFARFTAKDLIRLAGPMGAVFLTAPSEPLIQVGGLGVAACLGAVWYLWRPHGKPLDVHVVNAVKWFVRRNRVDGRDVDQWSLGTGDVLTADGYVVGFIEVTPTNLSLKSEAEQDALHSIYQELLETVSYPVKIHSIQEIATEQAAYGAEIASQTVEPAELKQGYLEYWKQVCSDQPITTRHYISIRLSLKEGTTGRLASLLGDDSSGYTTETAPTEMARRCREVIDVVTSADLSAERVTGDRLADVAEMFDDGDPEVSARYTTTSEFQFNTTGSSLGSKRSWRRTYVLTEFPSSQRLGWPTELLGTGGPIEVTQVIRPEESAATVKRLNRTLEKLSAEINSWLSGGHLGTTSLEAKLEDVNWMLDRLTDRQDKPFTYRCYVTVNGRTATECDRNASKLKNTLDTLQISYQEPVFRTENVFKAVSPFYPDPHVDGHLMPGSSVAAGFPFGTEVPQQTSGIVYGEDPSDGRPIVLDRFMWSSHSMARMGMVGSGKSYAAKLELLRSWVMYDDVRIVVVDPKREYGDVVRVLGSSEGCIQTLHNATEYTFDHDTICFQTPRRGRRDDVDLLVDVVEQIYEKTSQDRRKTIILIDEARILLNDKKGRRVLNRFVLEARDTNTAITLVTQNASHFTHSREGREILDNMPAKIFMRHDRVPDSVTEYFDLSMRERQALFKLRTGTEAEYSECLLQVSDRVDTTARIRATSVEHRTITASERGDQL